jgi:hypothetical protein
MRQKKLNKSFNQDDHFLTILCLNQGLKIGYFEKIYPAVFEKSAHSGSFYDFIQNSVIFDTFFYLNLIQFLNSHRKTTNHRASHKQMHRQV